MKFKGAVIDGPLLGKNYVSSEPYFYIAIHPKLSIIETPSKDNVPSMQEMISHLFVEYRFNHRLKVWRVWNA